MFRDNTTTASTAQKAPGRSLNTTFTANTAQKAPGRSTGRASLRSSSLRSCGPCFVGAGSSGRPLSFPPCRLIRVAHPCRLIRVAHPCRLDGPGDSLRLDGPSSCCGGQPPPPQPIARWAALRASRTPSAHPPEDVLLVATLLRGRRRARRLPEGPSVPRWLRLPCLRSLRSRRPRTRVSRARAVALVSKRRT